MSQHSAGPWVIQDNAAHGVHIYSAGGCFGGGFHLARLSRPGVLVAAAPGESERQLRANARLMSAAPELLAVLRKVVAGVDEHEGWQMASTIAEARAAIAKAEGEA